MHRLLFLACCLSALPSAAQEPLSRDPLVIGESATERGPVGYFAAAGERLAMIGDFDPGRVTLSTLRAGRYQLLASAALDPVSFTTGFTEVSTDGDRVAFRNTGSLTVYELDGSSFRIRRAPAADWWRVAIRGDVMVATRGPGSELCVFDLNAPELRPTGCVAPPGANGNLALRFDGATAVLYAASYGMGVVSVRNGQTQFVTRQSLPDVRGEFTAVPDGPDILIANSGSVFVYRAAGGSWSQQARFDLRAYDGYEMPFDERDGFAVAGRDADLVPFRRDANGQWRLESTRRVFDRRVARLRVGGPRHVIVVDENGLGIGVDIDGERWRSSEPLRTTTEYYGFGFPTAMNREWLATGGINSPIHVFRRRAGAWLPEARLPGQPAGFQNLGESLAIGDGALLAAGFQMTGGGYARVAQDSGAGWRVFPDIVDPAPDAATSFFGAAVALDGARLAVTAPSGESGGSTVGRVAVFDLASTPPRFVQALVSARLNAGTRFGLPLAAGRGFVVVGDQYLTESLAAPVQQVAVFRFDANAARYVPDAVIEPPSGAKWRLEALRFDGETIVVPAAPTSDGPVTVYTYRRAGGRWSVAGTVASSIPNPKVAIDGSALTVLDGPASSRRLRVSERVGDGWTERQVLADVPGPQGTRFASDDVIAGGGRIAYFSSRRDAGFSSYPFATWSSDAPRAMPPNASGMWYDPARSGEGWFLERLGGGRVLMLWYTYPVAGSGDAQSWILATGTETGNVIVFDDALTSSGPRFGAAFDTNEVAHRTFGEIRMAVEDCGNAYISYAQRNGETALRRVTKLASLAAVNCDGAPVAGVGDLDGAWFDPARSGEGILVQQPAPGRVVASWFTYDDAGRPMWLFADGTRTGNSATLDVLRPIGTRFGEGFDASAVRREPWGTFTIERLDCSRLSLRYQNASMATREATLILQRLTQPIGTGCR